jgi:hypothetical protein
MLELNVITGELFEHNNGLRRVKSSSVSVFMVQKVMQVGKEIIRKIH